MTLEPANHEELTELAALYALGILPASERTAFAAHLVSCDSCAAEVRSLAPVVGALAQVVVQADPRPALREQVLGSIRGARAVSQAAARPRTIPVAAWVATAASLVAAIALASYAAQLRSRIDTLEARLREMTLRVDARQQQIIDARLAATEAKLQTAVLAAPDLARIDLAGQRIAPRAAARAFWSRSRGLVFTASNLPPLPAGRIYQLWVVTAQAPISAGLLVPDADGRITAVFNTPPDIPQPVAVAVTLEPAGGVPAPTGAKYLVGSAG